MSNQVYSNKSGVQSGTGFEPTAPSEKMPTGRKILTLIISLLIVIVLAFIGKAIINLNEEPESKKRPFNTLAVMAAPALVGDEQLSVQIQGEANPQTEIDLVPQVGGKIVYVSPNFIEGGIFKKGELLVRIDPADYNVSVVRAQSALAQAEQLLAREKAEGDVARLDYAELGAGTPSDLALRIPQQQQAQAAVEAARAELDGARLQLKRTEVRAAFSGRVRSKNSDIGQFVGPGTRLGRVFSTDVTEVRLALSDNDLSRLNLPIAYVASNRASAPHVNLSAVIGGQMREWTGQIMRTDSTYDTMTRALTAIVEVKDPYGAGAADGVPLAPGLFVDATITGKTFENVITFPRDGLRPGNEIYVVDDKGKAEIRTVSVLDTNSERAVISDGVAPGELIVLSPMEKSRISTPLKVLDHNDPKTVLVEPEKPEWMKKMEAGKKKEEDAKPKGFFAKLFPKKEKDPNTLDGRGKQELLAVMEADYAKVMNAMTDDEKSAYRKMGNRGKAEFVRKKLSEMPETPAWGDRMDKNEKPNEDSGNQTSAEE